MEFFADFNLKWFIIGGFITALGVMALHRINPKK